MQKKTPKKVDARQVPEVVDFLTAESALEEFRAMHEDVFTQYALLIEQRNAALERAEKICRHQQISCGPFDLYQYQYRYNAEALLGAVGREQFLALGGRIEQKSSYALDTNAFEFAASQGRVAADVVEQVRKEVPYYHVPEKIK